MVGEEDRRSDVRWCSAVVAVKSVAASRRWLRTLLDRTRVLLGGETRLQVNLIQWAAGPDLLLLHSATGPTNR
jgi:hypothetical protein